jgi:uncharacterized protein YjbI with pentapeptide repeats
MKVIYQGQTYPVHGVRPLPKERAGNGSPLPRFPIPEGQAPREADFHGITLCGVDQSGGHYAGYNFEGADLSHSNFEGCDFTGANLSRTRLTFSYLAGANLQGADLSGADLASCDLTHADLRGANLSGVTVSSGTKWIGVRIDDTTQMPPALRAKLDPPSAA